MTPREFVIWFLAAFIGGWASGMYARLRRNWQWRAVAFALARHIRNTDLLPPAKWGVDAMRLLARVRRLDPDGYDAEVMWQTSSSISAPKAK